MVECVDNETLLLFVPRTISPVTPVLTCLSEGLCENLATMKSAGLEFGNDATKRITEWPYTEAHILVGYSHGGKERIEAKTCLVCLLAVLVRWTTFKSSQT